VRKPGFIVALLSTGGGLAVARNSLGCMDWVGRWIAGVVCALRFDRDMVCHHDTHIHNLYRCRTFGYDGYRKSSGSVARSARLLEAARFRRGTRYAESPQRCFWQEPMEGRVGSTTRSSTALCWGLTSKLFCPWCDRRAEGVQLFSRPTLFFLVHF